MAIALGLGTMVGWKRIVVTVGEKIGKTHLTYAQGASAELVAAATIGAADVFGLPVSTTHVLSSGVAGTMAANGSGLQMATVRNLLMAWVLTLPAAIMPVGRPVRAVLESVLSIAGAVGSLPSWQQPRRVTEGRSTTPAFCFPRGPRLIDLPTFAFSPRDPQSAAGAAHAEYPSTPSRRSRSHSRGNARQFDEELELESTTIASTR